MTWFRCNISGALLAVKEVLQLNDLLNEVRN